MPSFRLLTPALASLALSASCQGSSASPTSGAGSSEAAPASGPRTIEVKNAVGTVTARVIASRPCRATIDGVELIVGQDPLVAMIGATTWAGADDDGGTLIQRDGIAVARLAPAADSPLWLGLFSPDGVAMIRAELDGATAKLVSSAGAIVRTAARTRTGITVGDATVTGTDDVLLAAVLSSPEAGPEVRGLAACRRLLPPEKKAAL